MKLAESGLPIKPNKLNPLLFDFQRDVVSWALRKGRAALFLDCGMGKTVMQLEFAQHVPGDVLILAPLAVAQQTVREAQKFGIKAEYSRSGKKGKITVANYEMLEHFSAADYEGILVHNSSILKSFDGAFRNQIIEAFAQTPFRLACTATPAPNDYMELGNHSEFLGALSRTEMLSTFFVHDGGSTKDWRVKRHAQNDFWKWVCSWAVMMRRPSDLGYPDRDFILPEMEVHDISIEQVTPTEGMLFAMAAETLQERRQARTGSVEIRAKEVARIVLTGGLQCQSRKKKGESTQETNNAKSVRIQSMPLSTGPITEGPALPNTEKIQSGSIEKKQIRIATQSCVSGTPMIQNTVIDSTESAFAADTEFPRRNTDSCMSLKEESVPSAAKHQQISKGDCASITATQPDRYEDFSVANAISASVDSGTIQGMRSEPQPIFDSMAGRNQWLIWTNLNVESETVTKLIPGAVEITGSNSREEKESRMLAFSTGEIRVLVTKPSIAGHGLNWQNCCNVVFLGLSDSYEDFYQAVRRAWRFGQKNKVNCYIVTSSNEGAVTENIKRKERDATQMAEEMVNNMHELNKREIHGGPRRGTVPYATRIEKGQGWEMQLGDAVELTRDLPTGSIHYSIFSPPFASLYTYSASERDMGNCRTHSEFYEHFRFLVNDLFRVMMAGRLVSFHCMNLPKSKERDGVIGITDFRGELIRMFEAVGFIYHSEVVIWKDPVTAMQRTKAIGLLHKQLKKDSTISRQGIPDYLVTMRKPGENPERVTHTNESFPVSLWQKYASPVWMDINPSNTLQRKSAREHEDERHICSFQLQVIQRAIALWTNPKDVVLSPFAGIGSEGYVALQEGRRFLGFELKESYFKQACLNLKAAKSKTVQMFEEELDNEESA